MLIITGGAIHKNGGRTSEKKNQKDDLLEVDNALGTQEVVCCFKTLISQTQSKLF